MKANKITNSINLVINEDKFSKYSMQQVYDELGKDGFIDYTTQLCSKIIKSVHKRFNAVIFELESSFSRPSLLFYLRKKRNNWGEENFVIDIIIKENTELKIEVYYNTGGDSQRFHSAIINGSRVNFSEQLKSAIKNCYDTALTEVET
jgi:predicted ester cyclase